MEARADPTVNAFTVWYSRACGTVSPALGRSATKTAKSTTKLQTELA